MKSLALFLFLAALAGPVAVATDCAPGYAKLRPSASEELAPGIRISPDEFDEITDRLRRTLSGNLATVLRSEWKAKGDVTEANRYVAELAEVFLTPETHALVTRGLDVKNEGYIRTVGKRLFDLAEQDKQNKLRGQPAVLKAGDRLGARDPAPPAGARDFTFTYYTRPVADELGGKHQLRIRNYLREVTLPQMVVNEPVAAFDRDGAALTLVHRSDGRFELNRGEEKRLLSLEQAQRELGEKPIFFASPQGGKFKLEVKTRLKDLVSDRKYPPLGGRNLVQKLDVSLSPRQVSDLFKPLPFAEGDARREARARLQKLRRELSDGIALKRQKALAKPDADPALALKDAEAAEARADAVFLMLNTAVEKDPSFLRVEGATLYSRSAFEIAVPDQISGQSVKMQTTVDRDLGIFRGVHDATGTFLDPLSVYRDQPLVLPASERERRHWELKVPLPLVAKEAGLRSAGEAPLGIDVEDGATSPELQRLLGAFVKAEHLTNRGKFKHNWLQAPIEDRKPTQ